MLAFPNLRPMRLSRRSQPFDSEDFIYELKSDGFRALAYLQNGRGELVSRNGNTFHGFAELANWIAEHVKVESAVLDGELACVDSYGWPRDLLLGSGSPFHPTLRCNLSAFRIVCPMIVI
jgi:ATP-dependent DNA ligase